jgi:hypothetical protein
MKRAPLKIKLFTDIQAIETKSRKFKKFRNNLKRDEVIAAELFLPHFKSSTVNKDKFVDYPQERAKVTQS